MFDHIVFLKKFVNNKILYYAKLYNGRVQFTTGKIIVDTPTGYGPEIALTTDAIRFVTAISMCEGKEKVSLKANLNVKYKGFSARLKPNIEQANIAPFEEGEDSHTARQDIFDVFKVLMPFVGTDATRPWASCIHFANNYAYATNNVVVARIPFDWKNTEVSIPIQFIKEVISFGQPITSFGITKTRVTFKYADETWLSSSLLDLQWPDADAFITKTTTIPLPEGIRTVVHNIAFFSEDSSFPTILFNKEGISTEEGLSQATFDTWSFPEAKMNAKMIDIVLQVATSIDFSTYPKPCYFEGEGGLQGVIVGVR